MILQQRKRLLVNAAWFVGILLFSGGLVAGAMAQLNSREGRIAALEREIESKERALDEQADPNAEANDLSSAEAILGSSSEMTASESRRVVALSHAAETAGVTIVTLRSLEPGTGNKELPDRRSHTLVVRGDYRRLAEFMAALYESDGTVGIDDLLIEPEYLDEDATLSGSLRAAMRVTWYATVVRMPTTPATAETL